MHYKPVIWIVIDEVEIVQCPPDIFSVVVRRVAQVFVPIKKPLQHRQSMLPSQTIPTCQDYFSLCITDKPLINEKLMKCLSTHHTEDGSSLVCILEAIF